jgi:hypothetical protein
MKIIIIKKLNYKDCPIIIRRLNRFSFEYILVYDGQIYGTLIDDKLKWWQWWKVFLEEPYNNKQLNSMIYFLTKTAETTIETLIEKFKKDLKNCKDDKTDSLA